MTVDALLERGPELEELDSRIERAAAGQGGLVVVEGPAGIGKSRLIAETHIAQELYVTPKTVEVHLSNAYRKLGISSRRELAHALAA
jgi:ATP/maltotriose-dependent transcriptional regulator MalT